jgi:hypothetical protein
LFGRGRGEIEECRRQRDTLLLQAPTLLQLSPQVPYFGVWDARIFFTETVAQKSD